MLSTDYTHELVGRALLTQFGNGSRHGNVNPQIRSVINGPHWEERLPE